MNVGKNRSLGDLRGSQFLDAQTGQPLADVDALLERLALDDTGNETTSKGITRRCSQYQSTVYCCLNCKKRSTYPAPLVSLILSFGIARTLNCLTSISPFSLATAATVGSVPWVTIATRGRLVFFFGRVASFLAISTMSVMPQP